MQKIEKIHQEELFLLTGAEMAEVDRQSIEVYGIPGSALMETAGRAATDSIIDFCRRNSFQPDKCLVICGSGNNGGDGQVIARLLNNYGFDISILMAPSPKNISGSVQSLDRCLNGFDSETFNKIISSASDKRWLIIDAIFGTGLSRPCSGKYLEIIQQINHFAAADPTKKIVISIDIPSGICSNTGTIMGDAVKADLTCTFGRPKPGLFLYPGRKYRGELYFDPLGFPRELFLPNSKSVQLITPAYIASKTFKPEPDIYKLSLGRLGLIGGSSAYPGAGLLCARGALASGARYIYQAICENSKISQIIEQTAEIIPAKINDISELFFNKCKVLVTGPGISNDQKLLEISSQLIKNFKGPMIIDAGSLDCQAAILQRQKPQLTVLTPHYGEAAKLSGWDIDKIKRDKISAAREISNKYQAICLLKGPDSIISDPEGRIMINQFGNQRLARAGAGDFLSGLIGGLMLELDPFEATVYGVYLHARAVDIFEREFPGYTGPEISSLGNWTNRARQELFDYFGAATSGQNKIPRPFLRRIDSESWFKS